MSATLLFHGSPLLFLYGILRASSASPLPINAFHRSSFSLIAAAMDSSGGSRHTAPAVFSSMRSSHNPSAATMWAIRFRAAAGEEAGSDFSGSRFPQEVYRLLLRTSSIIPG